MGTAESEGGGVRGAVRKDYFKGAVKQRALQARLRATTYRPGDEYPTREVQRELGYLADRVYFGRSGLKGVTGNGLWAKDIVEEGEVISIYTGHRQHWGCICPGGLGGRPECRRHTAAHAPPFKNGLCK